MISGPCKLFFLVYYCFSQIGYELACSLAVGMLGLDGGLKTTNVNKVFLFALVHFSSALCTFIKVTFNGTM